MQSVDLVAVVAELGRVTGEQIAKEMGWTVRMARAQLSELYSNGILERTYVTGTEVLSRQYSYRIPRKKKAFPKIAATEYRFLAPTGFHPQDIRGVER